MVNFKFLSVLIFAFSSSVALATPITQTFDDSWTVNVGENGFANSATQWNYQPYVLAPENLTSTEVDIFITVSDFVAGDDFNFRASFFTGWTPAEYQFYIDQTLPDIASNQFTFGLHYLFDEPGDIDTWTSSIFGPNGHYYLESTTYAGSHTISATTTLTYNVPEPSTLVIFFLAGIALVYRRPIFSA